MTQLHYAPSSRRIAGATLGLVAAGCLLAAPPEVRAQATGVSVPQPVLTDSADQAQPSPAKPSAAIPATAATAGGAPATYGPYVPYRAPGAADSAADRAAPDSAKPFDPDASIVTEESMHHRPMTATAASNSADPDAGIVTHVPTRPGEINDGTLIRARLREPLSTLTTRPGSRFTAEVSQPVMQEGQVYIPEGSILEGRVSWTSAGRRIGGRAAIHLEPQRVTLPDGTIYSLHARVIDTSSWQNTAVDREGTIIRRDNIKGTLAAGGLVTGGAVAAGALIAGPAGALVGAGVGVGATAIVWFKQDRQAQLPKDLGLVFGLTAPLSVGQAHALLPVTPATSQAGGE